MPHSDSEDVARSLREELARRGITLPSLGVERAVTGAELIQLGRARPDVVQRLVEALREVRTG
ncbi:hypothetical protein [Streptomyces sp. NPDC049555]|uniref:hypothetical protein n=1 Tax=Streptomyces sp. NPDC049555 TaxID=3154930 RepID=UPI003419DADE